SAPLSLCPHFGLPASQRFPICSFHAVALRQLFLICSFSCPKGTRFNHPFGANCKQFTISTLSRYVSIS
ncbi:MAG: hypothetical protein ABF322_11795, partial [Lentimonas sp.]